jgi:hypothetical protein
MCYIEYSIVGICQTYEMYIAIAEILLKMALSTIIGNTSDTVELKYDDCRDNYDNQISKKKCYPLRNKIKLWSS